MSPHSCHVQIVASVSLLLMGLGVCHSATLQRLRIQRDTRNIPSNMFKSIETSTQATAQNHPATTSDFTISQQSTANSSRYSGEDYDSDRYGSSFPINSRIPDRFRGPTRVPFNTGYRPTNFNDIYNGDPSGFNRDNIRPATFPRSSGFNGFNGPDYSSMPLSIQTRPHHTDFPDHFRSFNGPSGSSSNNFYRSESYSYSSDGMGAPQVHQSVFDSRLGHGINGPIF